MPPNPYRRQPNINDMMYPKGSKQPRQVWAAVMNVYKAPETTPQPTPSPTGTANPTPTPSVTKTQTPTPSVTQTQTGTPSITPSPTQTGTSAVTPTPTPTKTSSVTPTPTTTTTPTPTGTPAPVDADATTYLNAVISNGGTLNSTLSAATQTLFYNLKQASLYTKLYAMYPILGGVAGSHMLNAKNPVNTNAAYRIAFSGTVTHSASGMTGNGTTGWGNTNFKGTQYVNNMSMGVYINATGSTTTGVQMGCDSTNGTNSYIQLDSSANLFKGAVYNRSLNTPSVGLTGKTGFYAVSKTGTTTNIYNQNGVSSTATTTNPDFNASVNLALMAYNNGIEFGGGVQSYSNDRIAFAYMSSGLTITELTTLRNIVQTFETSCGRNV